MNTEDKKRKLEELKIIRKLKQDEQLNQISQNQNYLGQKLNEVVDIDNFVNQLVSQKQNEKLYIEEKKNEGQTNIIQKIKRNLGFSSNVFSHNISMIVKIDAECQANLEDNDISLSPQKDRKSSQLQVKVREYEETENALPQKNKELKKQQTTTINNLFQKQEPEKKKEIPEEELKGIINSSKFQDFINKQSKAIERALDGEDTTLMEEIIAKDDLDNNDELKGELIRHQMKFKDTNYTSNRIVTDMNWSPSIDNLVLASYSENPQGNIDDPVGVALLWSLTLKSRPEFHLFANSQITSTCFNPYQSNQVIGGLASGQIVIWDLKAKSQPVLRTQMSTDAHVHPIFALNIIGSQKAHNICSISNDGKLCVWNLNNLSQPVKFIDLKVKYTREQNLDTQNEINVTCMQFPNDDPNNFYVGAEDGKAYQGQIHSSQMRSSTDHIIDQYESHSGPITSISLLNQPNSFMNGLLLTSSMDWSIKLWNPRLKNDCVFTFETAEDYVYDVQWNPVNPTIFGAVDGEGCIDIWDLTHDREIPRVHYKQPKEREGISINKFRWNNDSSKIITGDSVGEVNVYSVDKRLLRQNNDKLQDVEYMINNPQTFDNQQ